MISIPAFLLCLFTFTTNSHSVPEDPESLATNEGAPAWPDGTIMLQPPQLRHIKQTVVQELRLNSFQVSAESGTFRLNLRAIEVGAELTVGISQQVPANIVWVVINFSLASGVSEVVTAERM